MHFRPVHFGLILVVLAALIGGAALAQTGYGPPPDAFDTPAPAGSTGPTRGHGGGKSKGPSAEPSDTPEPPQFSTLDGVWEIEEQPLLKRGAVYSHLNLTQKDGTIGGYWLVPTGRKSAAHVPLSGSFDGRLIAFTAQAPNGTQTTFSGYVDNFGDMVGLIKTSPTDQGIPFTAEHRKKVK